MVPLRERNFWGSIPNFYQNNIYQNTIYLNQLIFYSQLNKCDISALPFDTKYIVQWRYLQGAGQGEAPLTPPPPTPPPKAGEADH